MRFSPLQQLLINSTRSCLCASAGVAALMTPTGAFAQTEAEGVQAETQAPAAAGTEGETIVITATKTGENLRESPVSATVLSGQDLRNAQISTISDITVRTPSLVYNTVQSRAQIYIRGVGSSFALAGAESAVATYLDGVYIQRQGGSDLGLFDVASVQVLRGPQSVLYGRNATGGAIVVTPNNPTRDFGGYVEGEIGNLDHYQVEGVVNVPLAPELALRLAGRMSRTGNWIENSGPGRDLGAYDTDYVRARLLWNPSSAFTATLTGEYASVGSNTQAYRLRNGAPCLACVVAGATAPQGFYTVSTNDRTTGFAAGKDYINEIRVWAFTLNMAYHSDDFTVTSVTSNRNQRNQSRSDNDLTAAELFFARVDESGPTFSQDLYLRTTFHGPFNFLVGGFYERERDTQDTEFAGAFFAPLTPGQTDRASVDALSLYADAWYNFTPALRLTAGLRWSHDKKSIDHTNDAEGRIAAGGLAAYSDQRTFEYVTPHVVLSYDTGADYYYASYSEGVRTGFFTTPSFVPLAPLESERLGNWEIGAKNSFLNGTVRTSLSLFYGKFSNLIVQYNDPASGGIRAQNAASAELYGAEAELNWRVTSHFTLSAGAAYVHNRFQSYSSAAVFVPGPAGFFVPGREDLSGSRTPRSPGLTGFLSAAYNADLGGGWGLRTTGNFSYTSSFDFSAGAGGPLRLDRQGAYALLDAQITLSTPGDHYYVRVFGRNLTNQQYTFYAASDDFGAAYIPARPRTYGLAVGANF
jgi:iron complex outermembrane receptor protein